MTKKKGIVLILLFFSLTGKSQQSLNSFLTPSDTLHKKRLTGVIVGESVAISAAFIGLNQLWYTDFPKSNFHFINDNYEWMQMDKVGHAYSGYHLSKLGADLLNWSGAKKRDQLIYGAGLGFLVIASVEIFDGYSKEWGASKGDLVADFAGATLYVSQELLWGEQRILPKFSFHQTTYATVRPDVLGKTASEQILKDYNGQTYWLSVNPRSFIKDSKIPSFLNIAFGYGAEGMIVSNTNTRVNTVFFPEKTPVRQFYASLDIDLTKIKTKHRILKVLFEAVNTIKIPAPTFEINGRGEIKWHAIYF